VLKAVAHVARPVVAWNHLDLMAQGETQLRLELDRRIAFPHRRDNIPAGSRFLSPGAGQSFEGLGGRLTFKLVGEDTRGAYSLLEVEDAPGAGFPLHAFRETDVGFYVLEGNYSVQVGGRTFAAAPGSFVFIPRGISIGRTNVGATPGKGLLITSPAGIEKLIAELSPLYSDPSARAKLVAIARTYGMEFIQPAGETSSIGSSGATQNSEAATRIKFIPPGGGAMYSQLNTRVTIKARRAETLAPFTLYEIADPPDLGILMHSHSTGDETCYVLAGEYAFRAGDYTATAPAGVCAHQPTGVFHSWWNRGSTNGRLLLLFPDPAFEQFVQEASRLPPSASGHLELVALARRYGMEIRLPPEHA
jgi:quercetin dioxygenase-like cupin family protein